MAHRGVIVSYESIRRWCLKFGPNYLKSLKRRESKGADHWYADEAYLKINSEYFYLWRAVDQDGDVLDLLIQQRRNRVATERLFRTVLIRQGRVLRCVVTDKLRSYPAAVQSVLPGAVHETRCYANNRAESSHQATRRRERQMQRFKSPGQAQRFPSLHASVRNLFCYGRHMLQAKNHRILRERAFSTWAMVTHV